MNREAESLKAFIAVKRSNELIESVAREDVKEYDLNLNEFAVLELLYHKGSQPIQKIKDKILIASSSTTYIIDKLCKKGYTERKYDSEDRRIIYASLTDSGRELISKIFPRHARKIEHSFSKLTDEELTQLRDLLKKLNNIND